MFSIRQLLPMVTFRSVALLMPECFMNPRLTSTLFVNVPRRMSP